MNRFLSQIFAQHIESGKKSTALQPINYAVTILLLAFIASFTVNAPLWVPFCLLCMIAGALILFWHAYIYFMKSNPDALRTEKFNLTKFAIERGLVGDNIVGALLSYDEKRALPYEPDDEGSS